MKLFILGAGASKAYDQSKTGIKMPIACDFFDTFYKLDISRNLWVLQGKINLFAIEKYHVDPYLYFRSGINIEDFHSSIEVDLIEAIAQKKQPETIFLQSSYNELVYLFASVINEIQNGPTSTAHLKLAKYIEKDDVVATFNWDTLMEKALEETKSWTTDNGYGFSPKSIYRNGWSNNKSQNTKTTQLYKLHGSTNWLTVHPSLLSDFTTMKQFVKPEDVYIYEYTEQPYSCHRGRFMDGYDRLSYGYYPVNLDMVAYGKDGKALVTFNPPKPHVAKGKAPSDGVPTIPLIIPPVKEKKYNLYGNLFENLWSKTGKAIEVAEEIILIGYSFPKTDIKSTKLFVDALMKRTNKPKIKILDPNPEKVVEKFKYEFGFLDSEIFVYKDLFSENFDIDAMLKS
ncbi:SIR2 family protein [Thalassotalea aquiviva]|uniref:SIR2 family protein n=1 Tax=Thalassotalea aquiviva TaxID=3242415 RepID=UPI00352BC5BF